MTAKVDGLPRWTWRRVGQRKQVEWSKQPWSHRGVPIQPRRLRRGGVSLYGEAVHGAPSAQGEAGRPPGAVPPSCDVVLDTFPYVDDALIYNARSLNNAHAMAWGEAEGRALLHAVWIAPKDGSAPGWLRYRTFDPVTLSWGPGSDSPQICPDNRRIDPTVTLKYPVVSPNLEGRMRVGWLQVDASSPDGDANVVCQTTTTLEGDFQGAKQFWKSKRSVVASKSFGPGQGSWRYLTGASAGMVTWYGLSETAPDPSKAETLESKYARGFVTRASASGVQARHFPVRLAYYDGVAGEQTEVASDPTVARSADGHWMVMVWEERKANATGQAREKRLMYVVGHEVAGSGWGYHGPYVMRSVGGVEVTGGDPSALVTSRGIYVTYQGITGGIFLVRRPLGRDNDRWDRVRSRQGRGYLGFGWFPNISGHEGQRRDAVAVVYERAPAHDPDPKDKEDPTSFSDKRAHTIELVFVEGSDAALAVTGHRNLGSAEHDASLDRYQMAAQVVVGPMSAGPGYLPVDVMWMDVDVTALDPADHHFRLMHRRYRFGGPCVPL